MTPRALPDSTRMKSRRPRYGDGAACSAHSGQNGGFKSGEDGVGLEFMAGTYTAGDLRILPLQGKIIATREGEGRRFAADYGLDSKTAGNS